MISATLGVFWWQICPYFEILIFIPIKICSPKMLLSISPRRSCCPRFGEKYVSFFFFKKNRLYMKKNQEKISLKFCYGSSKLYLLFDIFNSQVCYQLCLITLLKFSWCFLWYTVKPLNTGQYYYLINKSKWPFPIKKIDLWLTCF